MKFNPITNKESLHIEIIALEIKKTKFQLIYIHINYAIVIIIKDEQYVYKKIFLLELKKTIMSIFSCEKLKLVLIQSFIILLLKLY